MNVGLAGLTALGGPIVVWVDTDPPQVEIVSIRDIDLYGPIQAAAQGVSKALTLVPPGPLLLPRSLQLHPPRPFQVKPHHPEVIAANAAAAKCLQELYEKMQNLYPQYDILPNGLTSKDIYFRQVLKNGYHEQVHRQHVLWGLPRWAYYNQHQVPTLRELPLWWRRLFADRISGQRFHELMGEREKRTRQRRLKTRVRPRRRI